MANIKYYSEFYSPARKAQPGIRWRVELIDTSFSGSETELKLAHPGFELMYLEQGDERYEPIKGSSCKVHWIIENSTVNTFFNDTILSQKEERFFIKIYKHNGSAFKVYWIGLVLHDLSGRQDMPYPYIFHLTATDGLSRLKDVDYTYSTDPAVNDPKTMFDFIYQVLNQTPLYSQSANSDKIFATACNWFENSMPAVGASTDPLLYTQTWQWAFNEGYQSDTDKTLKPMKCYDVLRLLLLRFNLRIMQSYVSEQAAWVIVNVNIYEETNWYVRYYSKDRTTATSDTQTWEATINQSTQFATAGNGWNYYPPLRKVQVSQSFENKNMAYNFAASSTGFSVDVITLVGGTGRSLHITSGFNFYVTNANFYPWAFRLKLTIRLKLGSYYLKGDSNGSASWTTTSTDRYYYYIDMISAQLIQAAPTWGLRFGIDLQTPDIPSGSKTNNEFEIEATELICTAMTPVPTGITFINTPMFANITTGFSISQTSGKICWLADESGSDNASWTFAAANQSLYINSEVLDLEEINFGDTPFLTSNGQLWVWNGAAFEPSTAEWQINKTGSSFDINNLLVREIISGQIRACPIYHGQLLIDFAPHFRFYYNSETYILNAVTFSAAENKWDGEWFRVALHRSDYIQVDADVLLDDDNPGREGQRMAAINRDTGVRNANGLNQLQSEKAIAILSGDVNGATVTTLPVVELETDLIRDNDVLVVMPPSIGAEVFYVTVDGDAGSGATTIDIDSFDFGDTTLAAGTRIWFAHYRSVFNTLRLEELSTSVPGTVGTLYYVDNGDGTGNVKIKL